MNNEKKIKVALLLGGTSPEREVSKSTAASIYPVLQSLGYDVVLINPAYGINQPEDEKAFFAEKDFVPISNKNYIECLNSKLLDDVNIAFIALHGKWGEDGTIQSLLELRGIKYTGSKILSSALTMDKEMSKVFFKHYQVNTPKWFVVPDDYTNGGAVSNMIKQEFGFPCVIKPNDQGSTVGLTVCKDEWQVEEALNLAHRFSGKALIEEYIEGYEVTVGIIENKALPVLEIKPKHGLYDYECKYTSGMSEYFVPADLPKDVSDLLQSQALLAFNALGCTGYARADFRLNKDYIPYCLEINSLPGMTSTSLVPKMAKAAGISFELLIDRIIKLSL